MLAHENSRVALLARVVPFSIGGVEDGEHADIVCHVIADHERGDLHLVPATAGLIGDGQVQETVPARPYQNIVPVHLRSMHLALLLSFRFNSIPKIASVMLEA